MCGAPDMLSAFRCMCEAPNVLSAFRCMCGVPDMLSAFRCMCEAPNVLSAFRCMCGAPDMLSAFRCMCGAPDMLSAFRCMCEAPNVLSAFRCMCGAPNCRGTMDSQPERFKDFGKRLDVFWDGDSVFYRGTVTAYSTATRKHTILYDDNDVERVNLEVSMAPQMPQGAPPKQVHDLCLCLVTCPKVMPRGLARCQDLGYSIDMHFALFSLIVWVGQLRVSQTSACMQAFWENY